jgi:hypothetical protein
MTTIHFSIHHQLASSGVALKQKGFVVGLLVQNNVGTTTDVIPLAFRPLQTTDLHLTAQHREAETVSLGHSALVPNTSRLGLVPSGARPGCVSMDSNSSKCAARLKQLDRKTRVMV